jgi:putative hydrolase of the HAD superfamily
MPQASSSESLATADQSFLSKVYLRPVTAICQQPESILKHRKSGEDARYKPIWLKLKGCVIVASKEAFSMIKTLLFDVDGVLVPHRLAFSKKLASDHGVTREMTAPFFSEKLYSCLIGTADLKEEIAPYLPQWGLTHSVDEFLAYWFEAEKVVDHDLLASIARLREQGKLCYLATNQERYRTAYLLREMGFSDRFEGVFSSCIVGCLKTDPGFFEQVLRSLKGTEADEILFWDDLPENVEVARQVGLQAEVYTNFADFSETMQRYKL